MNQDLCTATLKSGIDTVIHGVARHVSRATKLASR